MPRPPPPIVLQQPATQTPAYGEHTYIGVLLTKDFESERLDNQQGWENKISNVQQWH